MAKAAIEVEIPDGYEFDRWDVPNRDEYILEKDRVIQVLQHEHKCIIVRKVEPVNELAVRFKPGWIAMDRNGSWWWYAKKPSVDGSRWFAKSEMVERLESMLQMPSVTDWKQSLMRVG